DTMLTSYEIQTLQGGRWKISAIFDDRELAIYEAKRMASGQRYESIRVVQENFAGAGDTSQIRVLYRSTGGVEEQVAGQVPALSAKTGKPVPQANGKAPAAKSEPTLSRPTSQDVASLDEAAAAAELVQQSLGGGGAPPNRGRAQGQRAPAAAPPMAGGPPMRRRPQQRRRRKNNNTAIIALIIVLVGVIAVAAVFILTQLFKRGLI
ncbi:MAG: hypothetical protein AAF220_13965, partial [Pseudomonadota bacterium]